MMIPSNTRYDWRLDIIRKHVKIGEARVKSCNIDFVEDAEVTRTMKAQVPVDGFKLAGIRIKQDEEQIYFDGTRYFNGTWCFSSVTGKWIEVPNTFDMFSDRLRPVMIINGEEYNFGDYMVIAAPLTDDGKEYVYDIWFFCYCRNSLLGGTHDATSRYRIYYPIIAGNCVLLLG